MTHPPTPRELEMAKAMCGTRHLALMRERFSGPTNCDSCCNILELLSTYGQQREDEGLEKAAKVAEKEHLRTDKHFEDDKPALVLEVYMNNIATAIRALKRGESKS